MPPTSSAPPASAIRPWQLFTLLALFCATIAVIILRGTTPADVVMTCLAIGGAGLVGIAALRALKPLVSTDSYQAEMVGSRTRAAIEREKNLVLRSIKELEFDHAMNKVSDTDFDEMTARLRARAVRLMKQLDSAETGYREIIERELARRLVKTPMAQPQVAETEADALPATTPAARAGMCGTCGTTNDADARFCKQCGAKLLAAIFAVLLFAGAAWAQGGFQMPDPKQMSGIPRPVTDLPQGHISVRLIRGQLSNNIPDFPVELQASGKTVTVKTDENGRAEFSGIPGGTPVKAVAVVDGERLESQEFPAPSQGGIRLMLVATPKGGPSAGAAASGIQPQTGTIVLGDQTRVIMDMVDDTLQVYYLLDVQNAAGVPVNPPKPIVIDMPSEAVGTGLVTGGPATVTGNRLTLTGPFPPGQTEIQVGYQMPNSSGSLTLKQPIPTAVGGITVLMKKIGDMGLTSPQLPQVQERAFQGDNYVLAQGPSQGAGSTLVLNITGLPHHSSLPRMIALVMACAIVGAGIWAAVKIPRRTTDAGRLKQLRSRREKLFAELVRLEQQRQTGAIDAARYAERRPALVTQLERVYRDLDTEGGQGLAA